MSRIVFLFVFFAPWLLQAELFPSVDDAPKATLPLDAKTFEFIASTLHGDRLAPNLRCEVKVETGREVRQFMSGSQWVEYIQIDYHTNAGLGGHHMKVKFPMSSKFGTRTSPNQWSGVGEDFKLEAGDSLGHWLRFVHDGMGHIVLFGMGNDLTTLPCVVHD